MQVIDALNWRYATHKFSTESLTEQQVNGLIESVRLAPASFGIQPYTLFVISSPSVRKACFAHSYGQRKVAESSHLFIFAHKTQLVDDDIEQFISQLAKTQQKASSDLDAYKVQIKGSLLNKTNEEQGQWAAQQCYIALGTLLSHAAFEDIDACPMTGFDNESINRALGLDKQGLNAVIMCPVGLRSNDDHTVHRPKFRLTTEQLVQFV